MLVGTRLRLRCKVRTENFPHSTDKSETRFLVSDSAHEWLRSEAQSANRVVNDSIRKVFSMVLSLNLTAIEVGSTRIDFLKDIKSCSGLLGIRANARSVYLSAKYEVIYIIQSRQCRKSSPMSSWRWWLAYLLSGNCGGHESFLPRR